MRPGERLADRFELHQIAGSGGMGQVFRATDVVRGELVAVKVLRGAGEADLERFAQEASALAALEHPGIVRYVAQGTADSGEPFLVMEWLEGEDLHTLLRRRRLTPEEAIAVVRQVAEALAHAHAHGIRHRDIKPANIFLAAGGVKLLDFGVARFDARTGLTQPGLLVGTPGYMAPEQARAGELIGPAADIFSLGCVFFEALTGQPPFRGDTVLSLLARLVFDEAPRIRDVDPDLPGALERLIDQMLVKDPARRIADGAALVEALARLPAEKGPVTPREMEAGPAAIGRGERRVVSIVLIGGHGVVAGATIGAEVSTVTQAGPPGVLRDLEAIAGSVGARVEQLADGSLALLISGSGVPKDQAVTAARVALALRARLPDRPIALTTGLVDTHERVPLGPAFERAALRLQRSGSLARIGALPAVLDEVTAALLDARFECSEGPDGPELWGEREQVDAARTVLGRATPCVGRDRELRALNEAFASCAEDGESSVVLVTGAPGAGKSRVAHEFLAGACKRRPELVVWTGRGDSMQAGGSLGLVRQALRGALGVVPGEPPAEVQRRLIEALSRVAPRADEGRLAAFLGELVGAPFEAGLSLVHRAARHDPQLMAEQTRQAFVEFVRHVARSGPLLLVLEDLQWGDAVSLGLVEAALRGAQDRAFMVLALARPEVHALFPRLWQGLGAQELSLRPLSARASEQLVRAVLGDEAEPAVLRALVERGEGNPFFLEELIRAASDERGEALPETLVATVRVRLESFDAESRRVLRAASVFGEACWSSGVANLLGRIKDTGEIRADLVRLAEAELLVHRSPSRFSGADEFAFRHALHREGAYAMLTDEDRALGHLLAAQWLESTGEAEPRALAEHFERAGRGDLAGRHLLAAAERAHAACDSEATLALARRGLASEDVPPDIRAVLLGLVADVHGWRGEPEVAASYAEEAIRLSAPGSTTWVRAVIGGVLGTLKRGEFAGTLELVEAAERVEATPETAGLLARPLLVGISALDAAGQLADSERMLARVAERMALVPDDDVLTRAWVAVLEASRAASVADDPWRGRAEAQRAARLFAEVEHRRGSLNAAALMGMNLWHVGASDAAIRVLRELLADHGEIGVFAAYPHFCLAHAFVEHGVLGRAAAVAEELIRSGQERGMTVDEGRGRWALACCRLRAGALAEAAAEIGRAREQLAVVPFELPGVLAVAAEVALARGEVAAASAASAEAARRLAAMGGCGFFFAGRVLLARAEALRAAGEAEAARAAIGAARERLRRIAATIPDSAYRAALLTGRPEHARTLALAGEWGA